MRLPWPAARMATLSGDGKAAVGTTAERPIDTPRVRARTGTVRRPCGAARRMVSSAPHDGHHRGLQPEGRRRQDDDGAQPARGDSRGAGRRPIGIDLDPQAHLSHVLGVQPRPADGHDVQLLRAPAPARRHRQHHAAAASCCARRTSSSRSSTRCSARASTSSRGCGRRCTRARVTPTPVVIDCCPLLNVLSLNAMFACDLVLVPVSADYLALRGREAGRAGAQRARAGVQATAAAPLPADALRRAAQDERAVVERMIEAFRPDDVCVDADPREREAGGEPGDRARRVPRTRRAAAARMTTRRWRTS